MAAAQHTAATAPGLTGGALALVAACGALGFALGQERGGEAAAMLPGLLMGLGVALVAGRKDWRRRATFFAFTGAVAWMFWGTVDLRSLFGELERSATPPVLQGCASLYLLGLCGGTVGGAGLAWTATVDRRRLTEPIGPLTLTLTLWALFSGLAGLSQAPRATLVEWLGPRGAELVARARPEAWNWLASDWIPALAAAAAALAWRVVRPREVEGARLVLRLAVGWWLGFSVLALALGLRLEPQGGGNWAGLVGLTVALLYTLVEMRLAMVAWAALVTGIFSGSALLLAGLVEQLGQVNAPHWDWSLWRQLTLGASVGLGQALVLGYLSTREPRVSDDPPLARWTESVALAFVLVGVTYLHLASIVVGAWIPRGLVPPLVAGWPFTVIFTLGYGVLALAIVAILVARRLGRRLPAVAADWLGKGQLLLLLLIWWLMAAWGGGALPLTTASLPGAATLFLLACLATVLLLLVPREEQLWAEQPRPDFEALVPKALIVAGTLGLLLVIAGTTVLRAIEIPASAEQAAPVAAEWFE